MRRHQTLRSTFKNRDGQPELVIANQLAIKVPVVNLDHEPVAKREAIAAQRAIEDCHQPFDVENGPLFRATLV